MAQLAKALFREFSNRLWVRIIPKPLCFSNFLTKSHQNGRKFKHHNLLVTHQLWRGNLCHLYSRKYLWSRHFLVTQKSSIGGQSTMSLLVKKDLNTNKMWNCNGLLPRYYQIQNLKGGDKMKICPFLRFSYLYNDKPLFKIEDRDNCSSLSNKYSLSALHHIWRPESASTKKLSSLP